MTMTSTERSRLYYARHRALGLCVLCNQKAALKANGEPGKFCEKHKKQRYSQRDEKRRRDAAVARLIKEEGLNLDDIPELVRRKNIPTDDALTCKCGGVIYKEYKFCPWCGEKCS